MFATDIQVFKSKKSTAYKRDHLLYNKTISVLKKK